MRTKDNSRSKVTLDISTIDSVIYDHKQRLSLEKIAKKNNTTVTKVAYIVHNRYYLGN